jgi:hypothetical protein
MVRAIIQFVLGAILFAFGAGVAWSETAFEWKKMGDWRAIENAWKYSNDLAGQESEWASTPALDDRPAVLGIDSCSRYQVTFRFAPDAQFDGPKNPDAGLGVDASHERVAHGRVLPSGRVSPLIIWSGLGEYFYFDVDAMVRG